MNLAPTLRGHPAHRGDDPGVALRRLARLCERIAAQQSAEDVFRLVVRQSARLIGAERTMLVLESRPRAIVGARLPVGEDAGFLLGAIAAWLDEAGLKRQASLRHVPEAAAASRQRSCAVAPLVGRDAVLGHLYADVAGALGRFDDTDRDLLAAIAVQSATTLDRLRGANEIGRCRRQLAALAEVVHALGEPAGDTSALLGTVVAACQHSLHGVLAGLSLVGGDGRIHLGAYRGPAEATIGALFPLPLDEGSGSGRCILRAHPVEYPDLEHDPDLPRGAREAALAFGFRSLAFAPLIAGGRGIGALWIARRAAGALAADGIGLLATLAGQAAIALRSERLSGQAQQAPAAAVAVDGARMLLAKLDGQVRAAVTAVADIGTQLLKTRLDSVQRDLAASLADAGDSLLAAIDDIRELGAIEAEPTSVRHEPFDLRECVESALDRVAAPAAAKGLDLACVFEDDAPVRVVGDSTRLRQILLELLRNAVRFTPSGEVVVSLGCEPDGTVRVCVSDTGIGMGGDALARLLPGASAADGTGLGLAISQRLAAQMGGTLHSESAGPGRGSTFCVSLPAPRAQPADPDRPADRGEHPALAGRRVLVVDDNPTIGRIVALDLTRWGVQVGDARSPAQALAWIRDGQRFDLALVDLHMPGMGGVDLAQRLHEIDPAMPQVLLASPAARAPLGDDERWFMATLAKPLRRSALFDTLISLFAGDRTPASCAEPGRPSGA